MGLCALVKDPLRSLQYRLRGAPLPVLTASRAARAPHVEPQWFHSADRSCLTIRSAERDRLSERQRVGVGS